MKKVKLSKISAIHYFKLVFRSLLLIWALVAYLTDPSLHHLTFQKAEPRYLVLLIFVWIVFALEMVLRFFPSNLESMGCQKQFKSRFVSTGKDPAEAKLGSAGSTFLAAASWIVLNGIIGVLYFTGVIDDGILVMISLFFSVSDMICILFFCPFQTLILKNRCCGTCRIYNWDYLMMFTPLVFARSYFTWSLVLMGIVLVVRWEITAYRYPERFLEEYNASLKCVNCQEKLCSHKKQLQVFWKSQRDKITVLEEKLQEQIPDQLRDSLKDRRKMHKL